MIRDMTTRTNTAGPRPCGPRPGLIAAALLATAVVPLLAACSGSSAHATTSSAAPNPSTLLGRVAGCHPHTIGAPGAGAHAATCDLDDGAQLIAYTYPDTAGRDAMVETQGASTGTSKTIVGRQFVLTYIGVMDPMTGRTAWGLSPEVVASAVGGALR